MGCSKKGKSHQLILPSMRPRAVLLTAVRDTVLCAGSMCIAAAPQSGRSSARPVNLPLCVTARCIGFILPSRGRYSRCEGHNSCTGVEVDRQVPSKTAEWRGVSAFCNAATGLPGPCWFDRTKLASWQTHLDAGGLLVSTVGKNDLPAQGPKALNRPFVYSDDSGSSSPLWQKSSTPESIFEFGYPQVRGH